MSQTVDYYLFLTSPWSYLAIGRFDALREKTSITVNTKPINPLQTFNNTGGAPLPKRHPSRQRYRMQELRRWSLHLKVPMNLTPKHFPADQTLAAHMVYAASDVHGNRSAYKLSASLLTAVWLEERNIADEPTLIVVANECGMDGQSLLDKAKDEKYATQYQHTTEEAHERDVFGSPTYVVAGENFWGQDRLDFLERHLLQFGK